MARHPAQRNRQAEPARFMSSPKPAGGRWILLGIVALFAVPVFLAILLHSQWVDWRLPATRQHGEFIDPPRAMDEFELVDALGRSTTTVELQNRWQLVYLETADCRQACLERLHWLRQIRTAQARHRLDVGLVFLHSQPVDASLLTKIQSISPDFWIFSKFTAERLFEQFPANDQAAFYIVDPSGNIIERFDADADPTGIRRDLSRLLTWTQRP